MKVLLVNPPYSRLRGVGQAAYFPLGLGCLATAVKDYVAEVRILDLEPPSNNEPCFPIDKESVYHLRSQAFQRMQESLGKDNHPAWRELRDVLSSMQPDLVGITVMTVDFPSALKVATIVKRLLPQGRVIFGGVHATFEPESCMADEHVDFVIQGEGEEAFARFCQELTQEQPDFSKVPNLVYRKTGSIGALQYNTALPLTKEIDTYFPPYRECAYHPERYSADAWGSIMASRGCPWKCSFCSSPEFWHRRLRYRAPERVVDEIESIVETGRTRHFTFWDDSFTANQRIIEALCRELLRRKLKVTWKTATRIDLLDDSLLSLMSDAGCIQLQIGIETGSPRMTQIIHKEIEPEKAIEAVARIKNKGIASGAFFMAGFPDERESDLVDTFQLMKRLQCDEMVINVFDPMPGSKIFEQLITRGVLRLPIDWRHFPLWPDAHFATEIESERFAELVNEIAQWLFSYNNRLRNRWNKKKKWLFFCIKYDRQRLMSLLSQFVVEKFPFNGGNVPVEQALGSFKRSLMSLVKFSFWASGKKALSLLSPKMRYALGHIVSKVLYSFDRRRRSLIETQIKALLGSRISHEKLADEVKQCFSNVLVEQLELFGYCRNHNHQKRLDVDVEGKEYLPEPGHAKRGSIFLTAHFGAHLMLIPALASLGFEVYQLASAPATWEKMVGKTLNRFEEKAFHIRSAVEQRLPATFIYLDQSPRVLYRVLENRKAALIFAFDGRSGSRWKEVTLFDRKMNISSGPFQLAHSTGALIYPSFVLRIGSRNKVVIHEPIDVSSLGAKGEAIEAALQLFTALFQDYVYEHPGHYGWLLQAAHIRASHDEVPLFQQQ